LKKTAEEIRLIILELHFINIQILMDLKLVDLCKEVYDMCDFGSQNPIFS